MKKIIFAIVFALLFLSLSGCSQKENTGCNSSGISLKEFNQIDFGDSEITVNNIIDPGDTWNDDEIYGKCVQQISQNEENHKYYYTYKYLGEKEGYAIITYLVDYSEGFTLNPLPSVSRKESFNLK